LRAVKIIIVGAGEIGRHLAESLSNRAHNISVIERDEALVEELNERLDAQVIHGEAASVTTLARADVGECDLFLGLTSDDSTNLVSASIAKALGARKTIARVHPETQAEQWLFNHQAHFHIDHLFSSERLTAVDLAKYVRNPERVAVEELGHGRIELQQVFISPHSQAVEQPLRSLKLPERVRIAFIQRHGQSIVPTAGEILEVGDMVTLIGEPTKLAETITYLESDLTGSTSYNVIILGGGEYGFALAQMLEGSQSRVRILERDKERCEWLTEQLQRSVVLNVDATSRKELIEEQVGEADFFIAVTGEDEDNVMMCLQARTLGVKYPIALVQRADYADVITDHKEQLGITAAVSPRQTTSRELLRFVTSERYQLAFTLAGGIEVLAFTLGPGSPLVEMPLRETEIVQGTGFVAVIRGNEAFVPVGADMLKPGDTLYVIVTPDARKQAVKNYAQG
jgi:trk system potassium uptake protein TrkA